MSVARPGQWSESSALVVVSIFDHSVDSCFLVSTRSCLLHANRQGSVSRTGIGGPAVVELSPVRPETLRRHLSVVLPWSMNRAGRKIPSLCKPLGVMDLSLCVNGYARWWARHCSDRSLNPISIELCQIRHAAHSATLIYICERGRERSSRCAVTRQVQARGARHAAGVQLNTRQLTTTRRSSAP